MCVFEEVLGDQIVHAKLWREELWYVVCGMWSGGTRSDSTRTCIARISCARSSEARFPTQAFVSPQALSSPSSFLACPIPYYVSLT